MGIKEIGTLGAILVFGLVIAFSVNGLMDGKSSKQITENTIIDANGETQEVTLKYENYGYVVDPPTVKAGIPVKMIADANSLPGCMKDVRIPAFGINKYITPQDNIIEFTPTTVGRHTITCSMGMGVGEIIVT
jgi:plastocyanin domain-containing protein